MLESPLSQEAIDLLEKNDYQFRWYSKVLTIKRGIGTRFLIISFTILFNIVAIAFALYLDYIFGGILLVVINLAAFGTYSKTTGRTSIRMDFMSGFLVIGNYKSSFSEIDNAEVTSKLVDEYTSAHKETSKEYQVTLTLYFKDGTHKNILTFIADYQEPTKEMLEVRDVFKNLKNIQKSLETVE